MPIHELIVIGIVFLLVLIDYITGVVNAIMHGELSSEKCGRDSCINSPTLRLFAWH